MNFYRDSADNAAAALDAAAGRAAAGIEPADPTDMAHFEGQRAYWLCQPRQPPHSFDDDRERWLAGYDAASLEGARTLREYRGLVAHGQTIRAALDFAGKCFWKVIKRVPVGHLKGLRNEIDEAQRQLTVALQYVPDYPPQRDAARNGERDPAA